MVGPEPSTNHGISHSPREAELKGLIEKHGAVRRGHFRLASGRHSDTYVEKFRILERPWLLAEICAEIVGHFKETRPDLVAGPSTGGMIVAYEVARQLGLPAVYVETDEANRRIVKRGGHIPEGARVLLVDDVLTTGISLREVVDVIQAAGAEVIGIGVLIDRSEIPLDFPCELHAACRFEAMSYLEDALPDWLAAIPLTTPGSRARHV